MKNKHVIIPIFVPHEGCPHNCVFCNQNTITGNSEVIDDKFVRNTIEEYIETIDINNSTIEVSFFGGTFTAIDIEKQTQLLAVANEYKEKKLIKYIRLSTRPDYINHDILEHLRSYKVDIIELGVQSLDDEVLKKSGRGHNEKDVVFASRLIKEYGFTLGLQVMVGLPGDTEEKDIKTAEKIIEMKPTLVRIYPSLVITNTPMETMFKQGIYEPYTLEKAVEISKVIYKMFLKNNINVIRIGLQPTEDINVDGEIVAGPFHPAFRELVEASLYKDILISKIPIGYSGEIYCSINPKDISKVYANKKKYFKEVLQVLGLKRLEVRQDKNILRNHLMIFLNGESRVYNLDTE